MTQPRIPRLSVDIVSDVMCPWCIIGWLKFEQVMAHFAGRLDFRVQWHPFELNPDMPPEGEDAAQHVMRKYGISAEQSRANTGRLAGIAADLGFAFNRGPDFRMRNSFDAHRLLTWAGASEEPEQEGATGVQTALKLALFRAHFTDNRDVGNADVLADIAASVGLDRGRAAAILASDEFGEMVRTEEAYWVDRNITGVPAFILGGRMLVPGAQDSDVFIRVIETKVLADVAGAAGLDRDRAAAILASGEFGEMVRTEERWWADRNITGVPAFILGGRMLIPGAQDPEVFVRIIENKLLPAAA